MLLILNTFGNLTAQHSYSLDIGKNKLGLNFAESYTPFDSTLVQVYTGYLDSKYCKWMLS